MNKKLLTVIIVIILLISATLVYAVISKNKSTQSDVADVEKPANTAENKENTPEQQQAVTRNGAYVDYSDSIIASTKGTKILFFHASWCPQCREIEASIKEGGIPTGVTVIKIDYDSHQALRKKYGVTIQTTFVKVDDAGTKIASYVAYQEPHFKNVERELLK